MTDPSAITPSALTAIVCVVRASAPAALALDHVVELIDAFVDVPVLSSLPKAAASGCMCWFDRVYQRTLGVCPLATPQRISEDWVAEHTLIYAIQAAVEHSHMAIVQRIHNAYPQRLTVRLLPIAASTGDLAMFQWLLAHRTDDFCAPDFDCDNVQASIKRLSCCLGCAYEAGVGAKQFHLVKWLLENGYAIQVASEARRPSGVDWKFGHGAVAAYQQNPAQLQPLRHWPCGQEWPFPSGPIPCHKSNGRIQQ